MFLLVGIPWLCTVSGSVRFGGDLLQDIFWSTCEYIFPLIFVLALIDSAFRILALNESALPVLRFLGEDSHGLRYLRRAMGMLVVFIGVLAIYSVVKMLQIENLHSYISNWLYAGYLTALLILILFILRPSTARYYLRMLSRLERDVVLHRISEREILERLTMEVFSPHFGMRIERWLDRMRAVEKDIDNRLVDLKASMKELSAENNPQKKRVIEENINKGFDEVECFQKDYRTLSLSLLKWLKRAMAMQQAWKEPVLTELINDYRKNYARQVTEFSKRFEKRITDLKALLRPVDTRTN